MDLPKMMMERAHRWVMVRVVRMSMEGLAFGHHDFVHKKPRVMPMMSAILMAHVAYCRVSQRDVRILWWYGGAVSGMPESGA